MGNIGLRILVVDDEQAIRRYLHASLNAHGYVVSEASCGHEALTAAAADHPDMIILDLLRVLVINAGKVLTHQQLLRQIRGGSYEDEMHLLPADV